MWRYVWAFVTVNWCDWIFLYLFIVKKLYFLSIWMNFEIRITNECGSWMAKPSFSNKHRNLLIDILLPFPLHRIRLLNIYRYVLWKKRRIFSKIFTPYALVRILHFSILFIILSFSGKIKGNIKIVHKLNSYWIFSWIIIIIILSFVCIYPKVNINVNVFHEPWK